MNSNNDLGKLTLAEQRVAHHVSAQFLKAQETEQAWLAEFVADLTTAMCDAYGGPALRAALQVRMEKVTDSTPSRSTRRTLLQTALAAAAARPEPRTR